MWARLRKGVRGLETLAGLWALVLRDAKSHTAEASNRVLERGS